MTPQDFIEKYLPDYEQKWKVECENTQLPFLVALGVQFSFFNKYFNEALKERDKLRDQQLVDKACEKQRDICDDAWRNIDFPDETSSGTFRKLSSSIINAPQPKLEDIK